MDFQRTFILSWNTLRDIYTNQNYFYYIILPFLNVSTTVQNLPSPSICTPCEGQLNDSTLTDDVGQNNAITKASWPGSSGPGCCYFGP